MKYRKKPVAIEACQPCIGPYPLPDWAQHESVDVRNEYFFVETLEGRMEGDADSWLIRGVEGELYPCKDSVFRATYEAVDGDASPGSHDQAEEAEL